MTPQTANRLRTRNVWADTVVVVSQATERAETKYAAPAVRPVDQSAQATKTPAEKEADRWVAQMMFESYNP